MWRRRRKTGKGKTSKPPGNCQLQPVCETKTACLARAGGIAGDPTLSDKKRLILVVLFCLLFLVVSLIIKYLPRYCLLAASCSVPTGHCSGCVAWFISQCSLQRNWHYIQHDGVVFALPIVLYINQWLLGKLLYS